MTKLNILQVTPALGQQGGVERVTVEMAAHIASRGAGSFVASSGGPLVAEITEGGSTHVDLPLDKRNPFTILLNAFRLARVIKQREIHLVHARSRAPAWSAFWACQHAGVPFVTTFHGIYGCQNVLKNYYNRVMTRGQQTIAVSEFIKRHVIEQYAVAEEKITVAAGGVDPDRVAPGMVSIAEVDKLRASWGCGPHTTVFLCVGRITRLKGHALMLRALAHLERRDWIVVIVGGAGKKQAYLQELQGLVHELGLSEHVVFAGAQMNVSPYYAAADIAVSASIEPESFGRVAVEAQAMGKPVVATAHGGALETVKHGVTGLLVDYEDPAEMTAAFQHMLALSASDRRAMGDRARRWVMDNFTIERMCAAEFSAYEKVLDSSFFRHGRRVNRFEAA